jgi:hypothetical protein
MVAAGLRTMIARSLTIIGERIIGAHRRPENHNPLSLSELPIVYRFKSQRSASRLRSPRMLRHPPAKLRWGDRHRAISRWRPKETAALQPGEGVVELVFGER